MSEHKIFRRFSDEEQNNNERLVRLEHGPDKVNESRENWNSYTKEQQDAILEEGNVIYADIAKAMQEGLTANDEKVQRLLDRWEQHLHYFYEPTLDMLRGLGQTYANHEGFRKNIGKLHPDLPDFLNEAIEIYVDDLETKALEEMIAEDEARANRLQQRLGDD